MHQFEYDAVIIPNQLSSSVDINIMIYRSLYYDL